MDATPVAASPTGLSILVAEKAYYQLHLCVYMWIKWVGSSAIYCTPTTVNLNVLINQQLLVKELLERSPIVWVVVYLIACLISSSCHTEYFNDDESCDTNFIPSPLYNYIVNIESFTIHPRILDF